MARLDDCYNIADLRDLARRHLPIGIFEYVDRGSEDDIALRDNREAFRRLKLRTRFLVDLSARDMGTELLGELVEFPLAIAPTGIAGLCWYEGELALAKAAAAAGVPFCLAMASNTSMETIARQAGGRLWFQVYMWKQEDLTYDMIRRARDLDFEALVVTIDSALGRAREHNERNGFVVPFRPNARALSDIARHPRWLTGVMLRYLATTGMPRFQNFPAEFQQVVRMRPGGREPARREAMTWQDIGRIRDIWPRTLIVKSTLTAEDATLAVEHGADGVVVSNYGGRAMDSATPTIDMLPEVVAAVGDRATVMLDSGVRRGSDIVKALALGARSVMIGRATLYGVATAGQSGATKALDILKVEFEKTMAYAGCRTVSDVGPQILASTTLPTNMNGRGVPTSSSAKDH